MSNQNVVKYDITKLKGVGSLRQKLFKKLGVGTVDALLSYYPRRYDNLELSSSIASAEIGSFVVIKATVNQKLAATRISGGRMLYKATAFDQSCSVILTWFNNRYTYDALKEGEEYFFFCKLSTGFTKRETVNPVIIPIEKVGTFSPVYSSTDGLSSKVISNTISEALKLIDEVVEETIPEDILSKYELISLKEATKKIHFPKNEQEILTAKKRLITEELLVLSIGMKCIKSSSKKLYGVSLPLVPLSNFINGVPFKLTNAQLKSIREISKDLTKDTPMNRLLQGDVGSGKTVVSAAAVFQSFNNGFQSAVMAPTEILASQHFETYSQLLEPFGVKTGFLTGSVKGKAREQLLSKLESGEIDLLVGTHAVISQNVKFKNLAVVITDEQHRFGVNQRTALSDKGNNPHVLVISATPIPRTLALIIYGDLDISVIDELPHGRKPIKTYVVSSEYKKRYLDFVRKSTESKNAVFIICPLVEDSEMLDEVKSASEYKKEIESYFKDIKVGLLHGKMKPKEKNDVMEQMLRGEISVLVSTTVIEVGIDIKRANLIIIENAERFGLSTLHQLRGRVGRGDDQSYCVLVSNSKSESSKARLETMRQTSDGFKIAQDDLKNRGPGDFLGRRQHGLPEFRIADLASDSDEITLSQKIAFDIMENQQFLESDRFNALRQKTEDMFEGFLKGRLN